MNSHRTFPRLIFRTETDGDFAFTPTGLAQRFYKLNEGPLRYSKCTLELTDNLVIEESTLVEGHLRVEGKIDTACLSIGIMSKPDDYRLMHTRRSGEVVTISYDGCEWDLISDAVVSTVMLHAGPDAANMILGRENADALRKAMRSGGGNQSLTLSIIEGALALGDMMRRFLRLAQQSDYFDDRPDRVEAAIEDLISHASKLVADYIEQNPLQSKIEKELRVNIAREIEALLWKDINDLGDIQPTLNGFALYFGVSQRTIQMAIDEVFDMPFTTFKHRVRLHQAREMLRVNPHHGIVSDVAVEYGFDHLGRFSQQYKNMFGVLPSQEIRVLQDLRSDTDE